MLDCLILGDSIAVGVGQASPGCTTVARGGIGSAAYLQALFPAAPRAAARIVISLGVNDDAAAATLDNLRRLRAGLSARRITWLLPGLKEGVRRHIRTVAAEHGDTLVDTSSQAGPDHLHPGRDGYRQIAAWTEGGATAASAAPAFQLQPFTGATRPAPLPGTTVPAPAPMPGSIYGAVQAGPFAAIPPKDHVPRAFTGLRPLMIGRY